MIGTKTVGPAISGVALKFVTGRPGQDITAELTGAGYTTQTIGPGGKFRLRAVVKEEFVAASLGNAATTQVSCLVKATSVGNPANADAVKFLVDIGQTTP